MVGVVDDDISVRKGLSRLLRSAGYNVTTFASAEECLAGLSTAGFGCLVVDVHLGGMSGLELLQKIRDTRRPIPIVFITAHDESITREALESAGNPPCLRKPFDASSLLTLIHASLDSA